MGSRRPVDARWLDDDTFEYNGPFKCSRTTPYSRRRKAGLPLDVPFDGNRLDPTIADSLNAMLSSTEEPSSLLSDQLEDLKDSEAAQVDDWFVPINGQEDNLTGLAGNFDYVKWNTMVVTSFVKQSQLGTHLQELVKVHPPVELHREFEDASGKLKRAAIMGKMDFQKKYGTADIQKLNKETKEIIVGGLATGTPLPGGTMAPPPVDLTALTRELDVSETSGDDEGVPAWRKLNPPPTGADAVPHPLAAKYAGDNFLPLDAAGNWVPPVTLPERDLRSLLDKDDPLYDVLLRAANDIIRERAGEEITPLPSHKESPKTTPAETASIRKLVFEDPRTLPNFSRRKWPALKKYLGRKRWHLIPVACEVNEELRWWLLVIDMQVQRRSGVPERTAGKEKQPHRALWVFDPCATSTKFETVGHGETLDNDIIFLGQVPLYLSHLMDVELKGLAWKETPVIFPQSRNVEGLRNLQSKTLPPDHYDLPGRFRHFETTVIAGGRRIHNNRNPQTGVEIIHAMARILWLIEMEDAKLQPAWRHMNADTLSCLSPVLMPGFDVSMPRQHEIDEGNDNDSSQNKMRTETMTEVQQYFNKAYLKAIPFRRGVPDKIPDVAYDMLSAVYSGHPTTWSLITKSFNQGAHGVLIGMNLEACTKHSDCSNCNIAHCAMALGTRVILHGKKSNHPFDNPKTEFWGNVEAMEILEGLPNAEKDSSKFGCNYNRYEYLRQDFEGSGTMPRDGGPQDPSAIIEQEYPQSMISLIIDDNGQGLIHVGNRPNSIWTVNGAKVTQSELIDRFSHITYLYGNGKHWLWLRRFTACESNKANMEVNVPGDINTYKRPVGKKQKGAVEQAIRIFPETTYLDGGASLKDLFYNMGHDTPHFHHHHYPRTRQISDEEKMLWNSQTRDLFLCQNPKCFQQSKYSKGKSSVKVNFTGIPCFDPTCVNNLPETKFYGNVTCLDPARHRCLPNADGQLRSHFPGIPGHMFLETGVMLFQPELNISNSEGTMNTRGINVPKASTGDDQSKIPQPPLNWSRVSFTAVKRFPSVKEARVYLRVRYNYDPIIVAEHESMGVAWDITMFERLNYYRILFWNQLDAQTQRQQWTQREDQRARTVPFSTYSISEHPDTTLRLGYQHPQDRYASGTASAREGTDGISDGDSQVIIGTGESWAWDLAHGHLPQNALPWSKTPDPAGAWSQTGYAGAEKYMSTGKTAASSGASDMRNLQSTRLGYSSKVPVEADKFAWVFGNNQRLQPISDTENQDQMEWKSEMPQPTSSSSYHRITLLSDPDSDLHIGGHDKLLPKVFYRPVPGGMIREECIQITKPDMPDPILVSVKQKFIEGNADYPKVEEQVTEPNEGQDEAESKPSEAVAIEDSLAELPADEIRTTEEEVAEIKVMEHHEQERYEEQMDELPVALSLPPPSKPSKSARIKPSTTASIETPAPTSAEETQQSKEGSEIQKSPTILDEVSPAKSPESSPYIPSRAPPRLPARPKRRIEEVSDPATAPAKKKRGRKKKVQTEDLPYSNEDMNEETLREDMELDNVVAEETGRRGVGRPRRARNAARNPVYKVDSD
ncbi:hypothetical protein Dda_9292 [Drechslerella dactyloides]|uniref:Uncharacterized protein n=1 Tax=Drechslerella dactyloides TaxID=74499 RepID=A0AAD6NGR5_DREDA|nr:hypothetical protein Dda_9292 [Drechslerella dactyloides]